MKLFVLIFVSLLPVFSGATTKAYQITAKLFIDGKLAAAPRIDTLPGRPAEISQSLLSAPGNLNLKVVATDSSTDKVPDGILMKFHIVYQKGKRILKSSPEILAKSGEDSSIQIGDKKGKIELKVNALRM